MFLVIFTSSVLAQDVTDPEGPGGNVINNPGIHGPYNMCVGEKFNLSIVPKMIDDEINGSGFSYVPFKFSVGQWVMSEDLSSYDDVQDKIDNLINMNGNSGWYIGPQDLKDLWYQFPGTKQIVLDLIYADGTTEQYWYAPQVYCCQASDSTAENYHSRNSNKPLWGNIVGDSSAQGKPLTVALDQSGISLTTAKIGAAGHVTYITGNIKLDRDFEFAGDIVFISSADYADTNLNTPSIVRTGRIYVPTGKILKLADSAVLRSQCGEMWKGIYLESNSCLYAVDNNEIRDAHTAISLNSNQNTSALNIKVATRNIQILHCYRGVYGWGMDRYLSFPNVPNIRCFESPYFYSHEDGMKKPYDRQWSSGGQRNFIMESAIVLKSDLVNPPPVPTSFNPYIERHYFNDWFSKIRIKRSMMGVYTEYLSDIDSLTASHVEYKGIQYGVSSRYYCDNRRGITISNCKLSTDRYRRFAIVNTPDFIAAVRYGHMLTEMDYLPSHSSVLANIYWHRVLVDIIRGNLNVDFTNNTLASNFTEDAPYSSDAGFLGDTKNTNIFNNIFKNFDQAIGFSKANIILGGCPNFASNSNMDADFNVRNNTFVNNRSCVGVYSGTLPFATQDKFNEFYCNKFEYTHWRFRAFHLPPSSRGVSVGIWNQHSKGLVFNLRGPMVDVPNTNPVVKMPLPCSNLFPVPTTVDRTVSPSADFDVEHPTLGWQNVGQTFFTALIDGTASVANPIRYFRYRNEYVGVTSPSLGSSGAPEVYHRYLNSTYSLDLTYVAYTAGQLVPSLPAKIGTSDLLSNETCGMFFSNIPIAFPLRRATVVSEIVENNTKSLKEGVFSVGNIIHLNNMQGMSCAIYDLNGRIIETIVPSSEQYSIIPKFSANGVYLLRTPKFTKKLWLEN